jgi:hypothetical protein
MKQMLNEKPAAACLSSGFSPYARRWRTALPLRL